MSKAYCSKEMGKNELGLVFSIETIALNDYGKQSEQSKSHSFD